MDAYEPRRKQKSTARERQLARQRKRATMATPTDGVLSPLTQLRLGENSIVWIRRVLLVLRDIWWYITHKPQVTKAVVGFVGVLLLLFVTTHVFAGRIFPNVWALGVHIGDMTVEEATLALQQAWENDLKIELVAEGVGTFNATPAELGLRLDAKQTAETARAIGMSGIPFGYGVTPMVSLDYITAQNFLLNLSDNINLMPFNAGYEWKDGEIIGVPGREGRQLDVVLTVERLNQDPVSATVKRRLDMLVSPLQPDSLDPTPYLEAAKQLASQPPQLIGYDPFTDESIVWTTSSEEFTRWLEAGPNSLMLREDTFRPYLNTLNNTLNTADNVRYLNPDEATESVQQAIIDHQNTAYLRIHYLNTSYSVVQGDTGHGISRKTGIPFYMIELANPGLNWNAVSIGTTIALPSRDEILPKPIVPSKRIIVNLDTAMLVAYENGQQKFAWKVSTGMDVAPTSPGIYQILDHNEKAIGSGVELCGSEGACGTWEMYWFMGIYEVTPGLINGFHGAVKLPNGNLLNNGNVGNPATYGCIMSYDDDAKALYDWAEEGVIVEIISRDFPPQSELGRQSLSVTLENSA